MNKINKNITLATRDTCTGCAACGAVCPTGSISMKADREGFMQPHIDTNKCIGCHKCEKTCPIICHLSRNRKLTDTGYAAQHKEADVLNRSKSGGAFYAIAEFVILSGGVVFGVKWDTEHLAAVHSYTETIEGLRLFQGSKYVQSWIGDSYKQVKDFLSQRRLVLFSGTPCQVAGLYAFLGKRNYENLILVDVICHGVSNHQVYSEYMHWKSPNAVRFIGVNQHNKRGGWRHPSISSFIYEDENNNIVESECKTTDDRYIVACTAKDYILRRSCSNCYFKIPNSIADLTLGDFWGVWDVRPDLFNNHGVSIILPNNDIGNDVLNMIKDFVSLTSVPTNDILLYQPCARVSAANTWRSQYRRLRFFLLRKLVTCGLIDLKYCYKEDMFTIIEKYNSKIIRKVRKIWRKIRK